MDIRTLNSRDREKILSRNAKQAAENADRKAKHDRTVDGFYDRVAEQMEPIVHDQLRKEGQTRKYF